MSYSFTKSIFEKWNVKTTPISLENPELNYHKAFLPNSVMSHLKGHIGSYESINGVIQQWSALVDDEKDNLTNMVQGEDGVMRPIPPFIFVTDTATAIEPFPTTEVLISSNVGVIRYGRYDGVADFPLVSGRKMFSMPPISPGINFINGSLEKGGFYIVFKCAHPEPFDMIFLLRGQINVHNN